MRVIFLSTLLFSVMAVAQETPYTVKNQVNYVLSKSGRAVLASRLLEFYKGFEESCDPTEGEDKDLQRGCEEAGKTIRAELSGVSPFKGFRFNLANVFSYEVKYHFTKWVQATEAYGCQIELDLYVTRENEIKGTNFNLYCD